MIYFQIAIITAITKKEKNNMVLLFSEGSMTVIEYEKLLLR